MNPQDNSKITQKIMEMIARMEADLNREMAIQAQAEKAFQILESPNCRLPVCLN